MTPGHPTRNPDQVRLLRSGAGVSSCTQDGAPLAALNYLPMIVGNAGRRGVITDNIRQQVGFATELTPRTVLYVTTKPCTPPLSWHRKEGLPDP